MITLRNFEETDAAVLQASSYSGRTLDEIRAMIADWRKREHNGKYSEKLAVVLDGVIVGMLFLYQHTTEVISIGPEIFPGYRKRGLGKVAMSLACDFAKDKGFKIVSQQIRTDNAASIALHTALGFESNGLVYTNQKGNAVVFYLKSLL